MKQDMPEIGYERSMNHNYMVLSKCDFFGKDNDRCSDFRTRMLLENRIPGLLPVTHRLVNGESRYYYEINSLQSLDRLYDKSEIGYDDLKALLSGCVSLFDRLEEYLLDGTQIIMKPELIYINVERMEPYFVCYPDYEGDVRLAFMEFVDELLTKVDHTDERAVMLSYQIYRYTRNPNYVISEIGHMMEQRIVNAAHSENQTGITDDGTQYSIRPREHGSGLYFQNDNMDSATGTEYAYGAHPETHPYEAHSSEEKESNNRNRAGNIGDLIGGIFCIFVSLCAGTIILGARVLGVIRLSGNNELYLCGAIAMAVMAAALFFACYIRKRRQDKELETLGKDNVDESESELAFFYGSVEPEGWSIGQKSFPQGHEKSRQPKACNETVCLGDGIVEERMLCGRMNGREVNISLDKLPMTIGKLASLSDFVINDTAVSKMHARFEEREGRVYVCDLNSTNGTVRNGVLLDVNESVALEPGDRLRFGRTCFTYC